MSAEDPEIEALTNRVLAQVFATAEANQEKFDLELLRLLGLLCVQFNFIEADFKYLLIVLREDDLPLREARKFALKVKWFSQLLDEVKKRFPKKFPDPAIVKEFKEIVQEADRLREERNLMLHSVWHTTSDAKRPFVRIKEDADDPEVDFDIPTVEKLVDRMIELRDHAFDFFCNNVPGYDNLLARLHDSKPPIVSTKPAKESSAGSCSQS
jgi:hypothetical protein